MKRAAPMFLAAMLACAILTGTALAAETPGNARPAAFYPVEVTEQTDGDYHRLEKVYILSGADDPAHIPTADFEREGWHYTLLDLTRQEQTDTETKYHTEIVTFDSTSKDMDKILPQLAATTEITTEDGYTGEVALMEHTIVAYTAIFSGTPIGGITPAPEEPGQTELPQPVQPGAGGGSGFDLKWLLVLPAAAGAVGLAFGGKHLYKMLKSKKEWRDYTK